MSADGPAAPPAGERADAPNPLTGEQQLMVISLMALASHQTDKESRSFCQDSARALAAAWTELAALRAAGSAPLAVPPPGESVNPHSVLADCPCCRAWAAVIMRAEADVAALQSEAAALRAAGPAGPAEPSEAETLLREIHDFARAAYASFAMIEKRGFTDMQAIVNKIRRYWAAPAGAGAPDDVIEEASLELDAFAAEETKPRDKKYLHDLAHRLRAVVPPERSRCDTCGGNLTDGHCGRCAFEEGT